MRYGSPGRCRDFSAFAEEDVRYLVVGGMAVVAHGYVRSTMDLDVVIRLLPENIDRAGCALDRCGFVPRLPIRFGDLADAETRRVWIEQKGMQDFPLWRPDYPMGGVDVFVEEPFDFDEAFANSLTVEIVPGTTAPIVSYDRLVEMKRNAGRPKDLDDIRALEQIREDQDRAR